MPFEIHLERRQEEQNRRVYLSISQVPLLVQRGRCFKKKSF